MRLTRLIVERFGSVRKARVEFGRGLNVLYGPNDLGKSTLAQAIRAALLLPPGSSAYESFVEWGTDETPKVELVFQVEPGGRYWRIRKEFGSGAAAQAILHGSADDQTWTQEAKGRKVDGEVRKLLSWGIPEPGGRGGTRGLPESFLTSVLLAPQTDPAAIFNSSIDEDADESGKKLLTHALQALAQDPLLKLALDEAQRRIDEAYTAHGVKKRGRTSPFKVAADAIASAIKEHEQRLEDLNQTQAVETAIEKLNEERLFAEEAREEAVRDLRELEAAFKQQAERRGLAEKLGEARQALAVIEQAREEVRVGAADESRLVQELERAEARVSAAEKSAAAVEERLGQARDELRRLSSGDAARERELARKTLETELLQLQAERTAAADLTRRARAVGDLEQEAEAAKKKIAAATTRSSALRASAEKLQERKEQAEHLREQLAGLALYELWQRARTEARESREAQGEARKLRAQIAELRRGEQEAGTGRRPLPAPEELKALRSLNQQAIEAEARLGGGLSATVRVKRPLNIKVSLDGGPAKLHSGVKLRRSFEAESSMVLDLGGVAEIELSAGEADAREKVEKLRARWERQGVPALKAAGVRSFAKLEDACREAEEARRESAETERRIEELERRVAGLDGLASQAAEVAARVKNREQALAPYDRDALEVLAARLGPDRDADVELLRRDAGLQATQADAERDVAARELAGLEAELKSLTDGLAGIESRRLAAVGELGDAAWEPAASRMTELDGRQAQLTRQLEALGSGQDDAVERAGRVVQGAEAELTTAGAAVKAAVEAKETALRALSAARGELRVRRERAEALDLEGARLAVTRLEAELQATESSDPEVSDEDLDDARERLDLANRTADDRRDQIQKLWGALEQVGGEVAHERERMAAEAVTRAREREAELDLDYGAWRLLHETLREVESEESVHLGRALVQPISERFARLTGGRYGSIDFEPSLKTKGIQAGGDTRNVDALSCGLRDQLATLFRLSVAEHLESLLVLDDQLAQTDPRRVEWFGQVLRDCAERIQIVLLTCRPREFLTEDEIALPGTTVRDSASGMLRAVDLEQVVDRAPLDSR